jgi:hypothetical protein
MLNETLLSVAVSFAGSSVLRLEDGHSLPSSTDAINAWSYTSIPHTFMKRNTSAQYTA